VSGTRRVTLRFSTGRAVLTGPRIPGSRRALDGEIDATPQPGSPPGPAGWRARLPGLGVAVVVLAALGALTVVLRRPAYILGHSFWLDEAWVVASTRAPAGQLRLLTSSTPIGWTLLLRLVPPIGSPERYRLLPLAFAVAALLPAWLLGMRAAPRRGALAWLGGAVVALAAATTPAGISHLDLKQYTADTFVVLSIAAGVAWAEAGWDRRRLAGLTAICVLAAPFSHATMFATAAGFAALGLRWLAERRWRRLLETVAGLAVAAAAQAVVYLVFTAPGNNPILQRWWQAAYVPLDQGAGAAWSFIGERLAGALERTGYGAWPVALGLVVLGLAGFWLAGQRALALFGPVLTAGLILAGAAELYPLLEDRTSLFFTILLTVYAAGGIAAVVTRLAARWYLLLPAAAVLAGAVVLVAPAVRAAGTAEMPDGDVREEVSWVRANARPGDVIVVNHAAQFAFSYYWPERPVFTQTDATTAVRYRVTYPGNPDIVMSHRKEQPYVDAAVDAAAARDPDRILVLLGWATPAGMRQWQAAARRAGTVTSPMPGYALLEITPPGR
jgi:hypothetical protein